MLYLIGLGLNEDGITQEGQEALKKCNKIYLEGYTIDFPYDLTKVINKLTSGTKKIEKLKREDVESNRLIKEAKGRNIALLVYGSPLFATTHISLVIDAKEQKVGTKIIYSASIFDAVAETGLQLYKFGKAASMPDWSDKGKSDSFMEIVKDNQKIKAHSLILSDIGLKLPKALEQLEEAANSKKVKLDKIIVCSKLGTEESKILYNTIENLKNKNVELPFCFIIPDELHFLENQSLKLLSS